MKSTSKKASEGNTTGHDDSATVIDDSPSEINTAFSAPYPSSSSGSDDDDADGSAGEVDDDGEDSYEAVGAIRVRGVAWDNGDDDLTLLSNIASTVMPHAKRVYSDEELAKLAQPKISALIEAFNHSRQGGDEEDFRVQLDLLEEDGRFETSSSYGNNDIVEVFV